MTCSPRVCRSGRHRGSSCTSSVGVDATTAVGGLERPVAAAARRSLSGFASKILADGAGGALVLLHDRLVALGADLATRWERPQRTPLHLLPSPRGPLFLGEHGIEILAADGQASTIAGSSRAS